MIVVKTTMRKIPKRCKECKLYYSKKHFGEPCCGASGDLVNLSDYITTKERADFCPLLEVKGNKLGTAGIRRRKP